MMTYKILVLDAAQRSALAVTRSLGKLPGIEVMTADSLPKALAGCSRFSSRYFQSPSPADEIDAYLDWIRAIANTHQFSLVIPVTEVTSQLLLRNHHDLVDVKLPFGNYESVMQLANKGKLIELARQLDIATPNSEHYARWDQLDITELSYPCVIKPCLSKILTPKGWIATTVKIVDSRDQLTKVLQDCPYLLDSEFMVQEYIPGHGSGVFCLFNRGQPISYFAHQRLREKPPQGGVSVYSESIPVDETLRAAAEKLLLAANWHGVAMVEFRVDPQGRAYLMEVNTRFWGSLQLAIDAGVDFPALLVSNELALQLPAPQTYRLGQRLRWLLGDVDSLYLYIRSDYSLKQKLKRMLQFLTPRLAHTHHEINRWGDMRPAWFELISYIKHLTGK